MSFDNRWLIEGQLTTTSPLRIGNGGITTHPGLTARDERGKKTGKLIEISAVATDADGCAYLPGSSIKGVLRARAKASGISTFEELFGSEDVKDSNAVGGKAEIWDALATGDYSLEHPPPYWRSSRLTGVTASVSLNRRTKTASGKRLFHQELVPRGVTFGTKVSGDFTEQEVDDLLFLLEGFNQPAESVTLGASCGDGWGRVKWKLTGLNRLRSADVGDWLRSGPTSVGYGALKPLPQEEVEAFEQRSRNRAQTASLRTCVTLGIRLSFEGPFLVNDPSQTGTVAEGRFAHTPLLDVDGQIVLPASSIRGAFRSQAERILRTLGNEQTACYVDGCGPRPACKAVYDVEELARSLCLACQLFGAPGWRAPIEFSDFKPEKPISRESFMTQELVAIDRFTGGGAESLKFNVEAAYRPTLKGSVTVDLVALARTGASAWALGLLALTLRDLMEGDIRLGFGAAKGYGAVHAEIRSIKLPHWNDCPDVFKEGVDADQWEKIGVESAPSAFLQDLMGYWLIGLEDQVQAGGGKR